MQSVSPWGRWITILYSFVISSETKLKPICTTIILLSAKDNMSNTMENNHDPFYVSKRPCYDFAVHGHNSSDWHSSFVVTLYRFFVSFLHNIIMFFWTSHFYKLFCKLFRMKWIYCKYDPGQKIYLDIRACENICYVVLSLIRGSRL